MPAWAVFLLSGALVVAAGTVLSRSGDAIAAHTGLGGVWVGAILVAAATSLPELSTDLYAVRQGQRSLAVGDLFGANMANMLILALLDLSVRRGRVLTRVAINQALVGALAIALTAAAAAGVLAGERLSFGPLGWAPVVIAAGYAAGMRLLHISRKNPPFQTEAEAKRAARAAPPLRRAVVGFALAALVILGAARSLATSAADLAVQLGISSGFMGVALLAVTTTLPELVTSGAAVRTGAYDLAVGNLLGSNCFNMAMLLALDLADGHGSLLAQVEPRLATSALIAILLMGQVLLDILHRAERRVWYLEPGPGLLILTYAFGVYLTYESGQ
jgi:cation:H+ antiporter